MLLPLPRILVAVFTLLPCAVTWLSVPPMFVAKFDMPSPARAVLPLPKRLVAKLKTDPAFVVAVESVPTTRAAPSDPSAWALRSGADGDGATRQRAGAVGAAADTED